MRLDNFLVLAIGGVVEIAPEDVVAVAADQFVIAGFAIELVVVRTAVEEVVARAAEEFVGAGTTIGRVVPCTTEDEIVAAPAVEYGTAVGADHGLVAGRPVSLHAQAGVAEIGERSDEVDWSVGSLVVAASASQSRS